MGVRGLATLVDENQRLFLTDHKLHDTRVVIDGSNLYHFLYYHYNLPVQYGGEYDFYARKCKHFIITLRTCNIEPYIIFDGGYNPDDRKLPVVLERMESRRLKASQICTKGRGCVLPILALETIQQVLVELKVPHMSCMYEADREIAVLAHKWQCPVLSNDSDFFIYGMEGGYVPLDYVNTTLCLYNTETKVASQYDKRIAVNDHEFVYIPVKFYHHNRFRSLFRITDADFTLPMFATVVGNDYVDPSLLRKFYTQIHLPKNPSKKHFNLQTKTHILAALYWLDTMDSCSEAIGHIMESIHSERKTSVLEVLNSSIEDYMDVKNFKSAQMDVMLETMYKSDASKSTQPILNKVAAELLDFNGNALPLWFVEKLRSCQLTSAFLQNITVNHRILFNCQIEKIREVSTYTCSRHIRSVTYGALLGVGDAETAIDVNKNGKGLKATAVEEYDRQGRNTRKIYVKPDSTITFGTETLSIPPLEKMPNTSIVDRQKVLYGALRLSSEVVDSCSDPVALALIGVLSVWIKNANPKVMESHLNAFIIGLIKLHIRSMQWHEKKQATSTKPVDEAILIPSVVEASRSQTEIQINNFLKHVDKHHVKPQESTRHIRDSRIVHGISQLQTCLLDTIYLNQTLLHPVLLPSPALVLNCSLVYNICKELESRPKPQFYIEEMLTRNSPLLECFLFWRDSVVKLCQGSLPEGFNQVGATTSKKKSSAKKSNVKGTKSDSSSSVTCKKLSSNKSKVEKSEAGTPAVETSSDSECDSERQSSDPEYEDVNNRFALLGID